MDLSKGVGLGMGQQGMAGGNVGLLRGAAGMGLLGTEVSLHHRIRCYRGSTPAGLAWAPLK